MGDGQGNPFISNPFMQGTQKKKTPPAPNTKPHSKHAVEPQSPSTPPDRLDNQSHNLSKSPQTSTSSKSVKSRTKPLSKSAKGIGKTKSASRSKARKAAPGPTSSTPSRGNGYKVQVLAKIPMPTNTNMPSRDYLWFAVYPIIPRVGDCIFHDGRYFRVDAVFLYENTNAGWCADLEVSYYTRRH